jgi:hypothetical protein
VKARKFYRYKAVTRNKSQGVSMAAVAAPVALCLVGIRWSALITGYHSLTFDQGELQRMMAELRSMCINSGTSLCH